MADEQSERNEEQQEQRGRGAEQVGSIRVPGLVLDSTPGKQKSDGHHPISQGHRQHNLERIEPADERKAEQHPADHRAGALPDIGLSRAGVRFSSQPDPEGKQRARDQAEGRRNDYQRSQRWPEVNQGARRHAQKGPAAPCGDQRCGQQQSEQRNAGGKDSWPQAFMPGEHEPAQPASADRDPRHPGS